MKAKLSNQVPLLRLEAAPQKMGMQIRYYNVYIHSVTIQGTRLSPKNCKAARGMFCTREEGKSSPEQCCTV